MLPDGRRPGSHLPLGDGMAKAVERAQTIEPEPEPERELESEAV